ncbi:MAG: YegS/Rv2252/BmrU family lipid kinase [Bacteroidales bacterium]|nr:YegS/Rv2252/BmrU family lipid kinase [Bacteroidales bacterium]MCM1147584.1 YegS/Rv2252/BmrU family lipid kinase [Bacteroidales bacterium]MCM1206374.1 YegS/Rv2252/BmrU family lipid kinase [Bacillota bacterium]MCM1509108.1 YegS/Rv2252/BmrU family lipid kinase [Clostridium sp.]
MDKKKIVFILNPISGTTSKAGIPLLVDTILDKEKFIYTIAETQHAGHASELARKAAEDNYDIAVAVGGDGTVNEVARALVNTKTALGIIPCGSGNGLARHLMLPLNVKGALEVINKCEIHDLDYGIINSMPFFCTCGMGFDAFISMKFANAGKRGPITYVENVLKEGLKYKPETYIIEDESGTKKHEAFLISIANASQYGNDAYIAPQASMSDGLMDIIIMEPFDMLEAAQVSIDMFNKTLDKNSKIKTFRSKHVRIHRTEPGVIHYDGDPIMADADLDISIQEKGIRIVINPDADKRRRQPSKVQSAFSEFMSNIHSARMEVTDVVKEVSEEVASDISKQGRRVQQISRTIQSKLNL